MKIDKYIGKVYKSNNFGDVKVVRLSHKKAKHKYYEIEFINTGNIGIYYLGDIKRGKVRDVELDRFIPRVSGVGYVGNLNGSTSDKQIRPLYNRWLAMLSRVYNKAHSHYNAYGGKGVTVDERWHDFSKFYQDVQELEGFNLEKFNNKEIELDKDMKQLDENVKVYSKDTCMWVSREENSRFKMNTQFKFKAVSPEGNEYESYSISGFCREHSLSKDVVARVLRQGKVTAPSLKGWNFYKI